jgi:hypothetical protein
VCPSIKFGRASQWLCHAALASHLSKCSLVWYILTRFVCQVGAGIFPFFFFRCAVRCRTGQIKFVHTLFHVPARRAACHQRLTTGCAVQRNGMACPLPRPDRFVTRVDIFCRWLSQLTTTQQVLAAVLSQPFLWGRRPGYDLP